MLSKPPISPPSHDEVAGRSVVPSTSATVLLYSTEFRRWIPFVPGSTPAPRGPGPLAPPLEPLPEGPPSIWPWHATAPQTSAEQSTRPRRSAGVLLRDARSKDACMYWLLQGSRARALDRVSEGGIANPYFPTAPALTGATPPHQARSARMPDT